MSGLDTDVAEAIMGHKLAGSRGSYFDFHDVNMVARKYMECSFGLNSLARVNHLERKVEEYKAKNEELTNLVASLKQRIETLEREKREAGLLMSQEIVKLEQFKKAMVYEMRQALRDTIQKLKEGKLDLNKLDYLFEKNEKAKKEG
jgi:predicted RNase H-like nuclease (RuvC/YqgF family)